ncbi:hypothetical protein [Enterococcus casseliflavus]|uniref:hypothetical protein n=1 Tax=Enterococcus casseliflavus TaxID=37734 RepID=UPI00232B1305|nr:hypothetical protein [Enterococcus casseliflavus]MDB1690163.1 hypothetical protein [Enterococcus casseliflavus]
MESKQTYLVACFDKSDCIDMMQEVFLMLNIDDQNKGNILHVLKHWKSNQKKRKSDFFKISKFAMLHQTN